MRGVSASVSRRGAGSGGRSGGVGDAAQVSSSGGPSRTVPAHLSVRHAGVKRCEQGATFDGSTQKAIRTTEATSPHRREAPERWIGASTSGEAAPERSVHRGRCGASLKHRARNAIGFGGLAALHLTRQASMSRGVEARGSLGTFGVPRALAFRGVRPNQTTATPAPQTIRAAELCLSCRPRAQTSGLPDVCH